ncbi:isoamylase early set domain-containing protein [Lutibacter sp. B1]|jgi:1,4-alpha-glucan branching enzyme|uniref:isoamylase early set domain-containing protein n=1 Tax=Lutibacter sp. B1 TaxID=2725996 RepID=UPI0014565C81|nr:isoamylase early set domain-containing protein [Lutibacter sp. B1]NLP58583.1 glycoside hydrolase [Lutibacter sp. B1]
MAIKKQFLKSKPVCKVTFTVTAPEATNVSVVGDFNEWDIKAAPLTKLKNGTFKGTLDLKKDVSYEFRYVIDGVYVNDDEADDYIWNAHAADENGILDL